MPKENLIYLIFPLGFLLGFIVGKWLGQKEYFVITNRFIQSIDRILWYKPRETDKLIISNNSNTTINITNKRED